MKRILYIIVLVLMCGLESYAQLITPNISDDVAETKAQKRKVFYGGSLAVTFSQPVYFSIAPTVGYQVSDFYNVGISIPYTHINNFGLKSNLLGIRYFNQFLVFRGAMIHAEYEAMNYPRAWTDPTTTNKSRSFEHSFNLGLGYRQYLTYRKTAWIDIYFLYNTKWKSAGGIYNSPFVMRTLIAFK